MRLYTVMGVGDRGHTGNTEAIPVQIREGIRGGRIAECLGGGERAGGIEAVCPTPLSVPRAGVPGDDCRRALGEMEAESPAEGFGDVRTNEGARIDQRIRSAHAFAQDHDAEDIKEEDIFVPGEPPPVGQGGHDENGDETQT